MRGNPRALLAARMGRSGIALVRSLASQAKVAQQRYRSLVDRPGQVRPVERGPSTRGATKRSSWRLP